MTVKLYIGTGLHLQSGILALDLAAAGAVNDRQIAGVRIERCSYIPAHHKTAAIQRVAVQVEGESTLRIEHRVAVFIRQRHRILRRDDLDRAVILCRFQRAGDIRVIAMP